MKKFLLLLLIAFAVLSCGKTVKIYLVRHAEKASGDTIDPVDPPLSEAGIERAIELSKVLRHKNIKAAYHSEFLRTEQTAAPLVLDTYCEFPSYTSNDFGFIHDLVDSTRRNLLIVGHSHTLLHMLDTLGIAHSKKEIPSSEYDNLFVIRKKTNRAGKRIYSLEERKFGVPSQ